MPTPEGRVKNEVRKIIDRFKSRIDSYWPVPSGYGPSHLDCILCVDGSYVAIETKAPGQKPTPRQSKRIEDVRRAGGVALVIDGTDKTTTYDQLKEMLEQLTKEK